MKASGVFPSMAKELTMARMQRHYSTASNPKPPPTSLIQPWLITASRSDIFATGAHRINNQRREVRDCGAMDPPILPKPSARSISNLDSDQTVKSICGFVIL
jgi:hypothetical protein